jgi:hypothetical protein
MTMCCAKTHLCDLSNGGAVKSPHQATTVTKNEKEIKSSIHHKFTATYCGRALADNVYVSFCECKGRLRHQGTFHATSPLTIYNAFSLLLAN